MHCKSLLRFVSKLVLYEKYILHVLDAFYGPNKLVLDLYRKIPKLQDLVW